MSKAKKAMIMHCMVAAHFLLMVGIFGVTWHLSHLAEIEKGIISARGMAALVVYTAALLMLSRIYTVYKVGLFRIGELVYSQTLANVICHCLSYVLTCILMLKIENPLPLLVALALQIIINIVWTFYANKVYFTLHKAKKTAVVYRSEADLDKLEELQSFDNRWHIEKRILWPEDNSHDLPNDGNVTSINNKDIYALIKEIADYDVIFVVGVNATLRNGIVKYCIEQGKDCFFVPHTGDVIISGSEHVKSFSVPILRARRANPYPEYLFIKRSFDIIASLIAIIIASPFMLVTALAIKGYDKGPAFYKQVRLTKDGRKFSILKFRSMKVNAEKDGVARLAAEHDDRITPVGKVIRAIRFDELPQLFNILKGDMTIVGPRPERPEIAEQYMNEMPAFNLRLQVKAGLTGYAQVYGRYNTEPSDKLKMDLMYVNNMGFMEDMKIMLATVRILFMRESTEGVAAGQTTAAAVEKEKSA